MSLTSLFLRESTAQSHREAEQRPLNRALARGEIPPAAWLASLEQHLLVYRVLERRIDDFQATHPAWAAGFAEPFRRRVPDFESDITDLGGTLAPWAGPAAESARTVIGTARPEMVVGMLYVSEGSTNGGRFLAKSAARALGVPPGSRSGFRSLDPYGDLQPARWASFKAGLDAVDFTDPERDQIRTGAVRMFEWVGAIADEVWDRVMTATAAPAPPNAT